MRKPLLALLCILPSLAFAAPAPPNDAGQEDKLFADLAKAESADEARPIEAKLATLFKISNSPSVDLLMLRAAAALQAADHDTARKLLDAVVRVAPDYAEGWRQRAQMQAAAGDDAGAMISLQRAVQLNPRHFAAMVELADMLEDYGDKAQALKLYRRALALDPQMEGAARHEKSLEKDVEGQGI
jgi:tetratricopeptide (TPR) repeat protein